MVLVGTEVLRAMLVEFAGTGMAEEAARNGSRSDVAMREGRMIAKCFIRLRGEVDMVGDCLENEVA